MKVLLQNYVTSSVTEPLYISECVNALEGCEATVWSPNDVSVYDIFDIVKPDLFITHYSFISEDLIKYLSGSKKTTAVFNVTMAQQEHLDKLDDMIFTNKIQCPFMFTNQPVLLNNLLERKTKLISIMHGADIFLGRQRNDPPDYEIDLGFLSGYPASDKMVEFAQNYNTYHHLTQNEQIREGVDLYLPAVAMYSLFSKYKTTVVSMDNMYIPQSFFDAVLYGNSVYYHSKYDSQTEKMNSTLQSLFKTSDSLACDFDKIVANKCNAKLIRKSLLSRHTCIHRTKRLFSYLKCSEIERELSHLIKETIK